MNIKLLETDLLPEELMPTTKEQSVSILRTYPMPYYNSLNPKNEVAVFESVSPAMAEIAKEFGQTYTRAFMVKMLIDLIDFFSVGKTMGATQVAQTVDLILYEFYYMKPDDFKLCFNRVKRGLYGKVYDRIDGQMIFEWLNQYNRDRCIIAEEETLKEAVSDNDTYERTSKKEKDKAHSYRLREFIDRTKDENT